jgi:hypothetical protein
MEKTLKAAVRSFWSTGVWPEECFVELAYIWERVARSERSGLWPSVRKGQGFTFAGVREAEPLEAYYPFQVHRPLTNRFRSRGIVYLKEYWEESVAQVDILLDFSGTMGFAPRRERLLMASAALVYSLARLGDRGRVLTFGASPERFLEREVTAYRELIARLSLKEPAGGSRDGFADAITEVLARRGKTIVIVVSDFYDADDWLESLEALAATRVFVPIIVNIHADEHELTHWLPLVATDPETDEYRFLPRSLSRLLKRRRTERLLERLSGFRPFVFGSRATVENLMEYFFERRAA